MGFKADDSFLRFLSMGAVAVRQTMDNLYRKGFEPIELERHCITNKIWATKVKRLRLPDLLCVKTGIRVEVRAKSDLKIRMSDAPNNPARVWDVGLRNEDLVAFVACFNHDDGPKAADNAVFFSVKALRDSVTLSTLGPPKSASEGAERDRTWPAIIPSRSGRVLAATVEKLIVEMNADIDQPVRKQMYTLRGKKSYVSAGENFSANTSILAGVPSSIADLSSLRKQSYKPLEALRSPNDIDRYAAIKALVHQQIPENRVLFAFEKLLAHEVDDRVALEAAASAAALGSEVGQQRVLQFIWENDNRADLRMEAVFLLTELGQNPFAREQLNRIARSPSFEGDEVRQAAVWGLGKAGLKYYQDVLPFIDDPDENVALHAMGAFGSDTPRVIIDRLVQDLVGNDLRRAPAASETLRIIGTIDVIEALIVTAQATHAVPDWILATLGRLPSEQLRRLLHGHPLLERISPMLLLSEGSNWLASINRTIDIGFLMKQNIF